MITAKEQKRIDALAVLPERDVRDMLTRLADAYPDVFDDMLDAQRRFIERMADPADALCGPRQDGERNPTVPSND